MSYTYDLFNYSSHFSMWENRSAVMKKQIIIQLSELLHKTIIKQYYTANPFQKELSILEEFCVYVSEEKLI
jgi:hypothetical protein